MKTGRKILRFTLIALLLVALSVSVFLLLPKRAEAAAPSFQVIGTKENGIWDETLKHFDSDTMKLVYKALTGISNATFDDVENKIYPSGKDANPTTLTSKDIRDSNGNNISLWFGGIKWDIVHVTTVRKNYTAGGTPDHAGDIVLTLWESATDNDVQSVKWSNHNVDDGTYPADYYATSNIRVNALNAGGYAATSNSAIPSVKQSQTVSNKYARFTMSSVENSLVNFIIQPKDIEYQETEVATHVWRNWPKYVNEAYSANVDQYAQKGGSYPETKFDVWKDDYIWLPSNAEVGSSNAQGSESGVSVTYSGIWNTDADLRKAAKSKTWLRSGNVFFYETVCNFFSSSGNVGYIRADGSAEVRPALHLNLSAAANSIAMPTDYEDTSYNASPISMGITDFEKLDCNLTSDSQSHGAEYDEEYGIFSATNVGTYTLEATPKSDCAWVDGTKDKKTYTLTITPAPITVNIPPSGEFSKDNVYEYQTNKDSPDEYAVKHKLKFPDSEYSSGTRTIISLCPTATEADKGSVKIYYIVKTHKESEHEEWIKNIKTNTPSYDDPGWEEYAENKSQFNVSDPGGYCVFYKIVADNHKQEEIGYFSVHIATETLIIDADVDLGSKTYGEAPHTQADLVELINTKITDVTDKKTGESRLDKLDKSKFKFYFKQDGQEFKTSDDGGSATAKWDAGEYDLWVRYDEPGKEDFIHFEWKNGRPKFTITPKQVELTWSGNANWESDRDNKASSSGDVTDEFCFVYDGTGKILTATYNAKLKDDDPDDIKTLDPSNISLISSDGVHVGQYTAKAENLKNYSFNNSEQTFKVVKAKNGWKQGTAYRREGWGVDDEPKPETLPQPQFGDKVIVTYLVDKEGAKQPYTPMPDFEEGTYYAKLHVDGTDDYDEIDEVQESSPFVVGAHVHVWGPWQSSPTKHWVECTLCHTHDREEEHTKQSAVPVEGEDGLHKLTCSVCRLEYKQESHHFEEYSELKPSTCTTKGSEQSTCECGKTDVREKDLLPHDYTGAAFEFDSENPDAGHYQVCKNCHQKGDVISHTCEHIDAIAATCVSKGKTAGSQCKTCGYYETEPQDTDMLAHDFDETLTTTIAATCTTAGSTTKHCRTCDSDVTEPIAALGHEYDEFVTTKSPTCTTAGKKVHTCSRCNTEEEVAIEALGHDFTKHERVEPTATEAGNIEYYECSLCETCFRDEDGNVEIDKSKTVIPALGTTGGSGGSDGGGSGSTGGNEGSVNPPLGGDTGLSGSSDFLEKNLWWIILIAAICVALITISIIISVIHSRHRERRAEERERERDRQFETFMKMQMMHTYGGMGGFATTADDGTPAVEGQSAPAQLPFNQEMFNAAVSAAVSSALAAINGNENARGGESDDVDGFYEEYKGDDKT